MKPVYWLIAVLTVFFSLFLALYNLGNVSFWDDESYTAIAARNYNQTGKIVSWDGRNLLGFRNGCMVDNTLAFDNPPLEIMVCAKAYQLLGEETERSARFLFALAGWLALLVLGYTLWHDFRESGEWRIPFFTFLLLALTPSWWLYARQAHYYPLTGLFGLLGWLGYRRLVKSGNWYWLFFIAVCSVALFYTQYLMAGVLMAAIAVHFLVFYSERLISLLKSWQLWVMLALVMGSTLPYAISHQIWHQNCLINEDSLPWKAFKLFFVHWREFSHLNVLPLTFAFFALAWGFRQSTQSVAKEWMSFGLIYFLVLITVSPQPTSISNTADIRYAIPVFPMFFMMTSFVLVTFAEKWSVKLNNRKLGHGLALSLGLVSGLTSITQLFPDNPQIRWMLPGLVSEITQPFPDAYRDISDYLKQHGKQDELVLAIPDFNNYPLQFFVGNKFHFGPILTETAFCGPNLLEKLPQRLRLSKATPDWLVRLGRVNEEQAKLDNFLSMKLSDTLDTPLYELDTMIPRCWKFMAPQRPELYYHNFGPYTECERPEQLIFIYRKRKK